MDKLQGIIDLPEQEYREAAAVCNSDLSWAKKSMQHYYRFKNGELKTKETDAMRFGRLAHEAVLDFAKFWGGFNRRFAVKPSDLNFATKDGKAWRAEQAEAGLEVISEKDKDRLDAISNSVLRNPTVAEILKKPGKPEVCGFAQDAETELHLKCRWDWLPTDPEANAIMDLKTCPDSSPTEFSRKILQFDYHRQAAFYIDMANRLGRNIKTFMFIAVEVEAPYICTVLQLKNESIALGRQQYCELLHQIKEAALTNKWPGYQKPGEITRIDLPDWIMRRHYREVFGV